VVQSGRTLCEIAQHARHHPMSESEEENFCHHHYMKNPIILFHLFQKFYTSVFNQQYIIRFSLLSLTFYYKRIPPLPSSVRNSLLFKLYD